MLNLRYGQTYFNDSRGNPIYSKEEIRSQLGIQGGFLDKIYAQDGYEGQFPLIHVAEYGDDGHTHGSNSNNDIQWLSREASGTYSQFIGNHTLKYGAQWRRLGLRTLDFGHGFSLRFGKEIHAGPESGKPRNRLGQRACRPAAGRSVRRQRDARRAGESFPGLLRRVRPERLESDFEPRPQSRPSSREGNGSQGRQQRFCGRLGPHAAVPGGGGARS